MNLPDSGLFRVPPGLSDRVEFWKKIYSRYTTNQVLIHDSYDPKLVYEIVDFDRVYRGKKASYRTKRRYVRKRVSHYRTILRNLSRQHGVAKTSAEKRVAALFSNRGVGAIAKASKSVRSQVGQANRFKKGLARSGRYMSYIRSVFRSKGLPEELAALPHVESSFNYKAYSSAGAAGIWQFTRSTGRLFMKINYSVDERRDPMIATVAAAKLLGKNHRSVKSWPLAVTAYNHGLAGMRRAKKLHGDNMATIIERYRGRTFGFASKNFYSEFLAALHVARNHNKYFGAINFERPVSFDEVKMANYVPAKALASQAGISTSRLKEYNPALRKSVWSGNRYIPKGYRLKTPVGYKSRVTKAVASLPAKYKKNSQRFDGFYVVRRGDTLSGIASRHRVSLSALRNVNGNWNDRIRSGQKLLIPGHGATRVATRKSRPKPAIALSADGFHVVQRGDSLYSIALTNGISIRELSTLNNISRRATIYPGQRLSVATRVSAKKNLPKIASVAPLPAVIEKEPVKKKKETGDALDTTLNEASASGRADYGATYGPRNLSIAPENFTVDNIKNGVGVITVDAEETLGHYAEWLDTTGTAIQRLNRGNLRRNMRIGKKVTIPVTSKTANIFTTRRLEYHMELLEDYFEAYNVDEEKRVTIQRGQSLWELCIIENDIPIWLAKLYNPGVNFDRLRPGDKIVMPLAVKKSKP